MILTNDGFDILLRSIYTAFDLKGRACTKRKGKGFVMFTKEVINLAGKQSS